MKREQGENRERDEGAQSCAREAGGRGTGGGGGGGGFKEAVLFLAARTSHFSVAAVPKLHCYSLSVRYITIDKYSPVEVKRVCVNRPSAVGHISIPPKLQRTSHTNRGTKKTPRH